MLAAFLALLAGGVMSQAVATPRDVPPDASSSISGRVTEQGSAVPLPRIVVRLTGSDGAVSLHALTDGDGRYQFTALRAGKYVLWAEPDEHRSTYLAQRFGQGVVPGLIYGPVQPNVELKPGEARAGMDIALTRALAVEGRVLDPWDEPIARVDVVVTRADGRSLYPRTASSDDRGRYRVYGLAPGRYRACARPEGRDMQAPDGSRLVRTCYPDTVIEHNAGDIVLAARDATDIDIHVQRIEGSSLAGLVTNAAGAPVDGALVVAYAQDDVNVSALSKSRDGEFKIDGLVPGRYIVRATLNETAPGVPPPAGREMEAGYAAADVGTTPASGIVVVLSTPLTVAGRVIFEGGPVPPVERLHMVVQMRDADGWSRFGRPSFSAVGDDLRFELKGVYRVPMSPTIYGFPDGWALKAIRYGGRDITDTPIDFGAASAPGRMQLVLTNRVARPLARVVDGRGSPVSGSVVVGVPLERARWKLGLITAQNTAADDKPIKLGTRLPGEYLLAAVSQADYALLMHDRARLESMESIATRVTIAEGDAQTIELRLRSLPPAK